MLVGLLYDETGDRLSPSHATKNGRRYRYYISHRLMQAARQNNDGWRIPAREVKTLVLDALNQFLSNERKVLDLIAQSHRTPDELSTILEKAKGLRGTLAPAGTCVKRQLVRTVVRRVDVAPGLMQIEISGTGLIGLLAENVTTQVSETMILEVPFRLRKRGVEAKLIVEGSDSPLAGPDEKLIKAVAKGFSWFEDIVTARSETVREISRRDTVDEGDVSRMIGFAFLAPDIVEAIVEGGSPRN